MTELNRQQLCAALGISESTVRRLELNGLPFTPVGVRSKRYDLKECKDWLRSNPPQSKEFIARSGADELRRVMKVYTESYRKTRLRVEPSE